MCDVKIAVVMHIYAEVNQGRNLITLYLTRSGYTRALWIHIVRTYYNNRSAPINTFALTENRPLKGTGGKTAVTIN